MKKTFYKAVLATLVIVAAPALGKAQCPVGNAAFGSSFQSSFSQGGYVPGLVGTNFTQSSFGFNGASFNPFLFVPNNGALLGGGFGANFNPFVTGGIGGFNHFSAFNNFGAFNPFFGSNTFVFGRGLRGNFLNRGFAPLRGNFANRGFAGRAFGRGLRR